MNVYDEYVKNQSGDGSNEPAAPTTNGGSENLNPKAEEVKDQEA